MPKIICSSPSGLTGSVGSVTFVSGEGQTEDEAMLAYFLENPDRFEVHEDEVPDEDAGQVKGDEYDALTDDEVAEAYATNVSGNATSRNGMVKALRKLNDEE